MNLKSKHNLNRRVTPKVMEYNFKKDKYCVNVKFIQSTRISPISVKITCNTKAYIELHTSKNIEDNPNKIIKYTIMKKDIDVNFKGLYFIPEEDLSLYSNSANYIKKLFSNISITISDNKTKKSTEVIISKDL